MPSDRKLDFSLLRVAAVVNGFMSLVVVVCGRFDGKKVVFL